MRFDLQVRRDELARTRVVEGPLPTVGARQALLRVEAFGLTANNITYARLGDTLHYWDFFPADSGWGRIPVWGYAQVIAAHSAGLAPGTRVFGYLPMGSHLLVTVDRIDQAGFSDRSPHRASLPAAYNHYRLMDTDPVRDRAEEDQQMTLWPLFFTSFLLADLLDEQRYFGAGRVLLSSASSRTAVGLAHVLAASHPDIEVIGLTSQGNRAFVSGLGLYDAVLGYEAAVELPGEDAVYVDFAGDAGITQAVHHRYAGKLRASIQVGATHGAGPGAPAAALPGPAPSFFFSPDRTRERARAWGLAQLQRRIETAWQAFRPTAGQWFTTVHGAGPEAVREAYLDVLHGRSNPAVGHVLFPAQPTQH